MTSNEAEDQTSSLDDEQRIDAHQMIGCGWSVRDTAKHYGLTEQRLRAELGMPQFKPTELPVSSRSLIENGGVE